MPFDFWKGEIVVSVIPLVTDTDRRTVVETDDAFKANGTAILIRGIDRQSLVDGSSNTSYDLRIGQEYRDHRDAGKRTLHEGGTIVLHPGTAVIIETEEFIHLPHTLFALLVPKVSLLQKGISNTMSKVDPGYQGRLLVTLFNLGKQAVTLTRYDRCCALCVMRVEGIASPYTKADKRIEGLATSRWWRSGLDFLERNTAVLTTILIVMNIVLILVQLLGE